jgi:hypothetical protein
MGKVPLSDEEVLVVCGGRALSPDEDDPVVGVKRGFSLG